MSNEWFSDRSELVACWEIGEPFTTVRDNAGTFFISHIFPPFEGHEEASKTYVGLSKAGGYHNSCGGKILEIGIIRMTEKWPINFMHKLNHI